MRVGNCAQKLKGGKEEEWEKKKKKRATMWVTKLWEHLTSLDDDP